MRVVIAEDSLLLREGLMRLLADAAIDVVATVGDGDALVAAIEQHRPDIAIVDVRMPPTHTDEGLRAAILARQRVPATAILVLSQIVEERYAGQLVGDRPEGVGYLLKERVADVADFIAAVRRVAAGHTVIDPEVVTQLIRRRRRGSRLSALTARELEVLALMAEGRSNRAISDQLAIGESAVEKHVTSIFGKLDLTASPADHRRVLAVLTYLA